MKIGLELNLYICDAKIKVISVVWCLDDSIVFANSKAMHIRNVSCNDLMDDIQHGVSHIIRNSGIDKNIRALVSLNNFLKLKHRKV